MQQFMIFQVACRLFFCVTYVKSSTTNGKSTEAHKGILNTLKTIKHFRNELDQEIKHPFLLFPYMGGVLQDKA